jgi:hypothetical protein
MLVHAEQATTHWNRYTDWAARVVVFGGQKISFVVLVDSSQFPFLF